MNQMILEVTWDLLRRFVVASAEDMKRRNQMLLLGDTVMQ